MLFDARLIMAEAMVDAEKDPTVEEEAGASRHAKKILRGIETRSEELFRRQKLHCLWSIYAK